MGLGEGVLQTYDLIPGLFLEGRFKASLPGMAVLIPWTWYETEARVGFRLPKAGYRDGGFDVESKRGLAKIPANRTWVPNLACNPSIRECPLPTKKKPSRIKIPF